MSLLMANRALIKSQSGGGFIAEYQAVYDVFTLKPSSAIAEAQNTMVTGWVNTDVWVKKDRIFVFAIHTNDNGEALIDWKNPGVNSATLVNAPTFTAFEGFTGDGLTQYIDLNYNPAIDAINYTIFDCSFGVYLRDNILGGVELGGRAIDGFWNLLATRFTGNIASLRINNPSGATSSNLDSKGMIIASRTLQSEAKLYKNKSILINSTEIADGLPSANMYMMAYNNVNVAQLFSTNQFSMGSFGGSLSQQNVNDETDYFEAYMDSNGKGVIT